MQKRIENLKTQTGKFLRRLFPCLIMALVLIAGITSCKTTGEFSGTAMLTIMLVDENGKGINDFNLELSNFNKTQKGITSSNGMCVFNNIPSGEYQISGYKNYYSKLVAAKIQFNNKSEVFCFEVKSCSYVLEEASRLYSQEDYEKGLSLLNNLVVDKKSELSAAVHFYKACGYAAKKEIKKAGNELKKMKSASAGLAEKYSLAVEQKIKEVESE